MLLPPTESRGCGRGCSASSGLGGGGEGQSGVSEGNRASAPAGCFNPKKPSIGGREAPAVREYRKAWTSRLLAAGGKGVAAQVQRGPERSHRDRSTPQRDRSGRNSK